MDLSNPHTGFPYSRQCGYLHPGKEIGFFSRTSCSNPETVP